MYDKLRDALGHISDRHIAEAASYRRKGHLWLGAVAAVLALVLVITAVGSPMTVQAKAVSLAQAPDVMTRPNRDDYDTYEEYRADWEIYDALKAQNTSDIRAAKANLASFFSDSAAQFLGDSEDNQVYSPMNVYIALSMLAEVTENRSRQQILELLATENTQQLRQQVSLLYESTYYDDGKTASILSNSLWLDNAVSYNQEVMDLLASGYYTSVYQGDLGSKKTDKALQTWVNKQTGGLLKNAASGLSLDPETVLTIASTVCFQAKWEDDFSSQHNTRGVFHAPGGDVSCTYMNKKQMQSYYYWGDSYGAVSLPLKNGHAMWLILPDEDKTVSDVLTEGQYLDTVMDHQLPESRSNSKYMKVNLSLPKFDISCQTDLKEGLEALGVTDVFDFQTSDFSAITTDTPICVTGVQQATRVAIDEDGVTAASYIIIPGAGAAAPPEEIIDFVLDRPFLFVITNYDHLPLFAGVVNQP